MQQKRLTASVIGGGTGGHLSLRALARSERFDLVAATDLRPEVCAQLEQEFPGLRTFSRHEDMFKECPTDVVCVSTYPPSHEEITLAALELPLKGILVEKPLGHTVASGRTILEAVKQRQLPMAVPHGLLARKTSVEIIQRVQQGEIGELKLVEIECTHWDIINAGIHWLNFFVTLTRNEPMAYVMALCDTSTRTYRDGMQVETIAITYAQTQSGIRVVMNTGDHVHISREGTETLFRLIGTDGQIEFWGWENGYRLQNAQFPSGTTIVPEEFPITGHQFHLENMAEMIAQGTADYAIPESSLTALAICDGAYLSSKYHCQVTFPVDRFTPPSASDWEPGIPYAGHGGGRDGRKLL
jgi:predicted dehydrogenase